MAISKVIVYARSENDASTRLHAVIATLIPENTIEISRSMESLSSSLSHCITDKTMLVLLASSKKELHGFFGIYDLITNIRIVLVLPDNEAKTIAEGYRLYPRFVTTISSDFNDVGAVLKKMLQVNQ